MLDLLSLKMVQMISPLAKWLAALFFGWTFVPLHPDFPSYYFLRRHNNCFLLLVFTRTSDVCPSNSCIAATCNICTTIWLLLASATWTCRLQGPGIGLRTSRLLSAAWAQPSRGWEKVCWCIVLVTHQGLRQNGVGEGGMIKRKVREGDGDIPHKYLGA